MVAAFLQIIGSFFGWLLSLFITWLSIFAMPFRESSLLWIVIPIWLSWFFAEFFQEKKSTSFGNAISNGVVPLWVAIDWTRNIVSQLVAKSVSFGWNVLAKFMICALVFIYGFVIIFEGIKAKKFIRYFGRIREVTYVLLMFTPIIYGKMGFSFRLLLAMVLFFPVFYYLIELIDRFTPTPTAMREDEGEEGMGKTDSGFGLDSGKDSFDQNDDFKL